MSAPKPTTAELSARIDLLEHALHETRQRADFISWALWDLAHEIAPLIWVDPFTPDPVGDDDDARDEARLADWERLGLDAVYRLYRAPHLEITHFEGMEPEDPRVVGGARPMTHAEAFLRGARERYAATRGVAGSLTNTSTEDRTA